jgi:hypothetical protein
MKSLMSVRRFLVMIVNVLAVLAMSSALAQGDEGEVPFPRKPVYEVSLKELIKFQDELSISGLPGIRSTSQVPLTWRRVLRDQWGNMVLAAGGGGMSKSLGDDETHIINIRTRQVGNGSIRLRFELDCFCDRAKGAKTIEELVKLFDEKLK